MKKIVSLVLIVLMLVSMLIVLAGCGSSKEDLNMIKGKVEKVISEMNSVNTYKDKKAAQTAFLMYSRDLYIELEELDNKGKSYIMKYDEDSENIPDSVKNDDGILCVYIASEKSSKMWTYATVDLNTKKVTWHDNY